VTFVHVYYDQYGAHLWQVHFVRTPQVAFREGHEEGLDDGHWEKPSLWAQLHHIRPRIVLTV
jgi:hypothetical protein